MNKIYMFDNGRLEVKIRKVKGEYEPMEKDKSALFEQFHSKRFKGTKEFYNSIDEVLERYKLIYGKYRVQ